MILILYININKIKIEYIFDVKKTVLFIVTKIFKMVTRIYYSYFNII